MFENLVEVLKANPRKIVYTEGTDARILESAARLKQGGFLTPILVGNVDDVKAAAKAGSFDIEGLEIIDPANYDKMDEMAQCMFDLRKGKMTMEEVRANLQKGNYFGTMLVKMGVADALLGEITPAMAQAVAQSDARRILIPANRCDTLVVGVSAPIGTLVEQAAAAVLDGCRN